MKQFITSLYIILLIPIFSISQGTSCASPIPITLDGACRDYTISSSTGSNLVCTSSGTSPITYFSVTSNSSGQDMLLNITGPDNQELEVAFYSGTTCNNGALEPASSICFYDGTGLWAPAESFVVMPNKTYIIRIKTNTTGTIRICGENYTPPNNDCLNATQLGTILISDNNACHKPASGLNPAYLCAPSLQNTAFYYYTVETTGISSVSLENTSCDNNFESNGNANGFQFGLFTGTCSSLTNVTCYVGTAVNAQASTGVLAAGTRVYLAINGVLGSNCTYSVRGINAMVLAADLKYFTAWKAPEGNILQWISLKEYDNKEFEVQRSVDGVNYRTIGQIAGQVNSKSEKNYRLTDISPPEHCFYRLKMVSTGNKYSYSNIVRVNRNDNLFAKILFSNNITDQLALRIIDLGIDKLGLKIIDKSGHTVRSQNVKINSGENIFNISTGSMAAGMYYLILTGENYNKSFPFLKL